MRIMILFAALLAATAHAAAPTVDAHAASADRNTSAGITVTLPTNSAGDLLAILVSNSDVALDALSGYTQVFFGTAGSGHCRLYLYYKTAGASEANPTITSSGVASYYAIRALAISGWDSMAPVTADSQFGGQETTFAAPDATATGDALVLRALSYCRGTDAITGNPDTLVGDANSGSTTNPDVRLVVTQTTATAGAVGTGDFTASTAERGVTGTILFHGGAGGGGVSQVLTLHQPDRAYGPQRSQQLGGLLQ